MSSSLADSHAHIKDIVNSIPVFFLLVIILGFTINVSAAIQATRTIGSTGTINYWPLVDVTIDVNSVIGINNLSLGFQIDYPWEWRAFRDRSALRQLSENANFKLVRIFDRHWGPLDYSRGVGPCTYWNEDTQTGTFDWADVDSVVQAIFETGAEPLICLSHWRDASEKPTVPPGMAVDPNTHLPYPESYAAFAAAWVQHFLDVGYPVKYYEIFNEIQTYIGWSWSTRNETRVENFIELFNAAYIRMHQVNPNVLVSFDASTLKYVFPRLLSHGVGIDSFNFHKYDDWNKPPNTRSDQDMFEKAERSYLQYANVDTYAIGYVRDTWFNQRGERLPTILSEGNWNAACNPTDERIQMMAGAVRTALLIRTGILVGLDYNIYYTLNSDAVWEKQTWGGSGCGYGMIDCDSRHNTQSSYNNPWYPYYVQQWIGSNLDVNDSLLETTCSSEELRILAWRNSSTLNILLIGMSTDPHSVRLNGVSGQLNFFKIDDSIPYTSPSVQEGIINAEDLLIMNGYTVMLLQSST